MRTNWRQRRSRNSRLEIHCLALRFIVFFRLVTEVAIVVAVILQGVIWTSAMVNVYPFQTKDMRRGRPINYRSPLLIEKTKRRCQSWIMPRGVRQP
ncbi:hypothetical protein EB234_09305 [Mesorhizobium japonicum R7A]|nr:hypothetical protein EB234_09305 [Mesorhizobium japonicum R7A]